MVDGCSDVGHEAVVRGEGLVYIDHHIGIGLCVVGACFSIVPFRATFRQGRVGGRIEFLSIEVVGVVYAHSP